MKFLRFFTVVSVSLTIMLGLSSIGRADLVGLWRFDQNANPQPDSSGKGGNGTLEGDVKWVNDAKRGGVMEFDGDRDYLDVPDSDALSVEGAITISAWANFATFETWNAIVGKTGAQANQPAPYDLYTMRSGEGWLQAYFGDGNGAISAVRSTDPPELESWQHIAVTVDEDLNLTHYLNGEVNGEGVLTQPLVDGGNNLFIGSRGDFVTNMNGRLDDVAIFSEALTAAQIKTIMGGDYSKWLAGGLLGDFNSNNVLDEPDLNMISDAVRTPNADKKYDVNKDNTVNDADRLFWVQSLKKTYIGDADLNGQFNTTDFVQVFQRGEYEDAVAKNSTWSDGDWNNDQEFSSGDFVVAFQDGGFEKGPKPSVSAVPEPSSIGLLVAGGLMLAGRYRRR